MVGHAQYTSIWGRDPRAEKRKTHGQRRGRQGGGGGGGGVKPWPEEAAACPVVGHRRGAAMRPHATRHPSSRPTQTFASPASPAFASSFTCASCPRGTPLTARSTAEESRRCAESISRSEIGISTGAERRASTRAARLECARTNSWVKV